MPNTIFHIAGCGRVKGPFGKVSTEIIQKKKMTQQMPAQMLSLISVWSLKKTKEIRIISKCELLSQAKAPGWLRKKSSNWLLIIFAWSWTKVSNCLTHIITTLYIQAQMIRYVEGKWLFYWRNTEAWIMQPCHVYCNMKRMRLQKSINKSIKNLFTWWMQRT